MMKAKCMPHPKLLWGEIKTSAINTLWTFRVEAKVRPGGKWVGPIQLSQGVETTLLLEHVTLMLVLVPVPNGWQR